MDAYLNNPGISLAVQRRFWGTEKGWPSTLRLLNSIRSVVTKIQSGLLFWRDFILSEVSPGALQYL
jgi:hypothetical protein